MADTKLYVSPYFFKQLSLEAQRMRLITGSQLVFIDRARVRAARIGDSELFLDLDEVESFHVNFREISDRLENIADRMVRMM